MHCKGISTPRTSGDGEVKEEGMEESVTPASTVSQTDTNNTPSLSSSITSSATEAVCHENVIDCVHVTTTNVTESGVSHVPYTVDLVSSAQNVSDDSSRNLEKSSENVTDPCATAQRITECVGVENCVRGVKDVTVTQCAVDSETMKLNISDTIITTGVTQSSSAQSVTLTDSVVFTQSVLTDSTVHVTQSVTDPVDVVQNVSDSIKSSDNGVAAVIEETSVSVLNSSLDSINACDSAVDTDDYCQDYLVIDPKDIKEEIDSDAEDTVDGNLTHHLRHSDISKVESDSNSSCSLNSSYGSGCWIGESIATRGERLYRNLSNSFPGTALTRMLRSMEDTQSLDSEDEDMTPSAEKLSWSWSGPGSIHKEGDDELTPLTWLQDADLLKNINADVEIEPVSEEQKENKDGQKNGDACAGGLVSGQTNLHNVQYNPVKNVNAKPPFSFSCLIFMAIENSPGKKLPVKEIYNWILANFPYYENAANGWKNSVRHNLSLNKCFKKVEKDKGANLGKGAFWCIDPEYRPNLLQALRKTPYHPYRQLQMMSTAAPQQQLQRVQGLPGGFRPMPLAQRALPNTVSPHLFPFLSRKMAQTAQTASNEKDYHAANALVELHSYSSGLSSDGSDASGPTSPRSGMKRKTLGPPKRQGPFIIVPPPSADHIYSSATILEADAPSRPSSIDEGYDFGDDDDDVSELSDYPSDWDEDQGDEVDGDIPEGPAHKKLKIDLKSKKQVAQKPEVDTPFASDLLSAADLLMSFKESGRLSYSGEEKSSPRKSSSTSSKARSSTAQITRSSSASPKRRASLASASKSSSLSSSQSSTSSSSSNKSSSQSTLSSRLSQKKIKSRTSLKSKAKASKTSASSKTAGAVVTKSARHSVESTGATIPKSQKDSSSEITGATVSKSTKDAPSRPLNKSDFKTPPSTKCLSSSRTSTKSSCSSSKTKASIIMTRREKAAAAAETASKEAVTTSKVDETVAETVTKTAEQAVEKVQSAHSMRTRGKKLNFKRY